MAAKTQLPSPKSRSKPDPSNTNQVAPVTLTIAADGGDAMCTIDAFGSLKGIPQAVLHGGAHALPLLPLSATMSGLGVVVLHYAEPVVDADLITWPEKDEAIRNRPGGYVRPLTFEVAGGMPTEPIVTDVTWNADTANWELTFDQDVAPAGPSTAGLIIGTTPDSLSIVTGTIVSIAGPLVVIRGVWSDEGIGIGTATSTGLGTAIVGTVGGLPANDFTEATFNQAIPVAAPVLMTSYVTQPHNVTHHVWSCNVNPEAGSANSVVYHPTAGTAFNNTADVAGSGNTQTSCECEDADIVLGPAHTINIGGACVRGDVSAVLNAAVVNFPCPSLP